MKKLFFISLVVFAVGAGIYKFTPVKDGVAEAWAPKEKGVSPRFVTEAKQQDINYTIEVSGDVAPEVQLEVKSEVGGKIKALYVEAGQTVKKGQLLCDIDDTDLLNEKASVMTQLEGAQLTVDRAQLNFERGKSLVERNLITKEAFEHLESDLAIARNGYAKAERQLQTVEDKLAKTKITAPNDGTLLSVAVAEGQVVIGAASVNSGTTLMMLADLSRLLLETHVNQVDVARLKTGKEVTLRIESHSEEVMNGTINFIAPVASTKNGVKGFTVKAFIVNPTERLRPGMTVRMNIPVAQASDVVAVPLNSVFKGENDQRVVYVLEADDRPPMLREVTIGISNLYYAEVVSGLKAGERILTVEPRFLEGKS